MNNDEKMFEEADRRFLRKHWKTMSVFAGIGVAAIVTALYVLTWFVSTAQTAGFIPSMLGQWTVGYAINFILHLIFWEILFVGSWVIALVAIVGYRWWKTLSDEEKKGNRKRSKRDGGNAIGFFVGIMWLIVVWFDGRWALAFESWTFNNWIYSCLAALGWTLLIFGIPFALYFAWWIRQGTIEEAITE
ncbi:hypothetical protein EU528_06695 [Candidatus Thorarchaeota archaeon]|nr:MAG: hypothetical protein EU528_06695 [Candidatus Thorarchaeota archaeon]